MVLIQRLAFLGLVLAGCSQSLFDDKRGPSIGGPPGSGPDGGDPIASACPAPCLADVAADFDGTPGGAGNKWRYLDDHRNRTWTAMTGDAMAMKGADPANVITTCAARPSAPACQTLPGALLVSAAGVASAADPAVELTFPTERVVQLSVKAFVPTGNDQVIRIYRNSREDVLFTATAFAGALLEKTITLDALTGDRFLVAVVSAAASADIALQVYVSGTTANFPSECQIALPFSSATGNTTDNICGSDFTFGKFDADVDIPPVLVQGPIAELGTAADFANDTYYRKGGVVNRSGDTTTQFWLRTIPTEEFGSDVFGDVDLDVGGGLDVGVGSDPIRLFAQTCTQVTPKFVVEAITSDYPVDNSWNFIRVVHSNGQLLLCLNGVRKNSMAVATGKLQSSYSPRLGSSVFASPVGARFVGQLDDLRVLNTALPCE